MVVTEENDDEDEAIKQSIKSEKEMGLSTENLLLEEEKSKKLRKKEKKLRENYYMIKFYMIIQKTANLILKNNLDTSIIINQFINL